MLTKRCDLCGNAFACYGDEKKCWCQETFISAKELTMLTNIGNDCFCKNCIMELKNSKLNNSNQELKIKTIHGIFQLTIKKAKTNFLIQIYNKNYRYPLLSENICDENEAIIKFCQYRIKLENNQFTIIRNIEALDENYRRVFSRVKYSILF